MVHSDSRAGRSKRALKFVPLGLALLVATVAMRVDARPAPAAPGAPSALLSDSTRDSSAARSDANAGVRSLIDSLVGFSGKLSAFFVSPGQLAQTSVLQRVFGDSGVAQPGVYAVEDSSLASRAFAFITMRPFTDKVHGRIGSYFIGTFPHERTPARTPAYRNPAGFIEVTPENEDTPVSEHFRLRDFLTHDQQAVWPKYLVLDEQLIDKLELVIADLNDHGVPVRHMTVMSGFRTPQYNVQGVGEGGRASDSRHQYGDAADVFVDNDGNGREDDLNHDGRVDWHDAYVVRQAVERVERANPQLVGGCGVYSATSAHGPFTHIDARGNRARWGLG